MTIDEIRERLAKAEYKLPTDIAFLLESYDEAMTMYRGMEAQAIRNADQCAAILARVETLQSERDQAFADQDGWSAKCRLVEAESSRLRAALKAMTEGRAERLEKAAACASGVIKIMNLRYKDESGGVSECLALLDAALRPARQDTKA